MKREDFIFIIKARSLWKIDKEKDNYILPNGEKLYNYVLGLIYSQLRLDKLSISANGDIVPVLGGRWNDQTKKFNDFIAVVNNEIITYNEHEQRAELLAREIIGM